MTSIEQVQPQLIAGRSRGIITKIFLTKARVTNLSQTNLRRNIEKNVLHVSLVNYDFTISAFAIKLIFQFLLLVIFSRIKFFANIRRVSTFVNVFFLITALLCFCTHRVINSNVT